MSASHDTARRCLEQLESLRAELADLAYVLECRGRRDAADVANEIAGRVREIRAELAEGAEPAGAGRGEFLRRSR